MGLIWQDFLQAEIVVVKCEQRNGHKTDCDRQPKNGVLPGHPVGMLWGGCDWVWSAFNQYANLV